MFSFYLLKFFSLLVYPLTQVGILLVFGLLMSLRGHRRAALSSFWAATVWLWLCSMPYLAVSLIGQLEKDYPPVAARNLPTADAIVLLGGAIRGEVSPDTLADMSGVGDRPLFAAAAFKAGRAPVIVVTGGADEGMVSEASLTRDLLVTMGVPKDKIVLEARNRVTSDNLRYTTQTLDNMGVQSILLVTSAFHMRRSLLIFDQLDLTVYPAPTDFQVLTPRVSSGPSIFDFLPSVKALQRTTWAFHEAVGYWYYRWRVLAE